MWPFKKKRPPVAHDVKVMLDAAKFEYLDCVKRIEPVVLRKGDSINPMFEFRMEVLRVPDLPPQRVLIQAGGRFVANKDMTINFVRLAMFQFEGAILVYETFPGELGGTFKSYVKRMQV